MAQKGKNKKVQKEVIQSNKKAVYIRIAIVLIITLLLIMSTYAWFTSQKDITLYNLRGTVEVAENMEISLDAKMWYHKIDLSKLVDGVTPLQAAVTSRNSVYGGASETAPNIEPKELLPVSTIGGVGSTYVPFYEGTAKTKNTTSLSNIKECEEIKAGNVGADNGYFAFDIYIKNTSRDDEPDTLQLNLNSAAQVLQEEIEKEIVENGVTTTRTYIGQSFSGIQNTLRVALALYEDTANAISTQKDVLDATKGSKISKLAIWEPNAPYHVQQIVDNNNKLTGSGAPEGGFEDGDALTTYALTAKATQAPATISNVYNTDDPNLAAQSTLQTEITDRTVGAEDYRILAVDGTKPIDLVDTDGELFTIPANKVSRLRVYVWMEGQDVDCINLASFGGGIELDLGLTKDNAVGNVLEESDDEGTEPTNTTVNGN